MIITPNLVIIISNSKDINIVRLLSLLLKNILSLVRMLFPLTSSEGAETDDDEGAADDDAFLRNN